MYWAWQPNLNPREATTRSPGPKPVTPLATSVTRPATSKPSTDLLGFVTPMVSRTSADIPRGTRNARKRASPEFTVAARDSTSSSPALGTGIGTSLIWTTSGGPYRSQTAAFIAHQAGASAGRYQADHA